jgi:type II secretory pathway pseudopilin PulG
VSSLTLEFPNAHRASTRPSINERLSTGVFRSIEAEGTIGLGGGGSPGARYQRRRWLLLASWPAFTLLEVMVAIAFIGFAMLALLSLHHSSLQSVARARELTQAAMLAQGIMSEAEKVRFPDPGRFTGDFEKMYPGQFPRFRWQRIVEQSPEFADIRRVRVTVFYGPGFRHTFVLTELMHNPQPQLRLPGDLTAQPNTGAPDQNTQPQPGDSDQ